jgi:hypothetical protein
MQMDLWTNGLFVVPLTGQRKREGRGRVGEGEEEEGDLFICSWSW